MRTCVGCRRRERQSALVRVARVAARVQLDPGRRLGGRGAYLHGKCVIRANIRSGLARALRIHVDEGLVGTLRQQYAQPLRGAGAEKV